LASPLNYAAIQCGNVESSSKRERGLDVSHHAHGPREGRGDNFFLDILFYRSVIATYNKQRPLATIDNKNKVPPGDSGLSVRTWRHFANPTRTPGCSADALTDVTAAAACCKVFTFVFVAC